jgi:hypothetical protein
MSSHLLLNRVGNRLYPFSLPSRTIIPHLRLSPVTPQLPRFSPIGIRPASTANLYRPPSGFLFNERVHPPSISLHASLYHFSLPERGNDGGERIGRGIGGFMGLFWCGGFMELCSVTSKGSFWCLGFLLMGRIERWALKEARLRIYEDGIDLDYKVD